MRSLTGAFYYCYNLTSVTIPNSVTSIGSSAFSGCPIEYANIPTMAISYISKDQLKEVVINSGDSIGDYAFYNCSSLESITIPSSVTGIGYSAFYNCSSLKSITIPNSVTSIGSSAFSRCPIEYANIPTMAISYIPKNQLKEVVINSGDSIGDWAFYNCSSLESVTIGNSVTSIGERAFVSCSSLESVTIGNSVTSIGDSAFVGCSSLESVTIGNSVTSIGGGAFAYCSNLTSVTIPNSVTSIGSSAFYSCDNLTSVIIPNSVTSIGDYAFAYCSNLTIYCEVDSKPSGWDSDWNSSNCTVVWGYEIDED